MAHLRRGFWAPARSTRSVAVLPAHLGQRHLRTPAVAETDRSFRRIGSPSVREERKSASLVGILETGGQVLSTSLASGRQTAAGVALTGGVVGSTTGKSRLGALGYLSGTPSAALLDSAGEFLLAGMPAGSFSASCHRPKLDSLGIVAVPRSVTLRDGEPSRVASPPG